MSRKKEFFKRVQNLEDSDIEEGIRSGDPYIICDLLEKKKVEQTVFI